MEENSSQALAEEAASKRNVEDVSIVDDNESKTVMEKMEAPANNVNKDGNVGNKECKESGNKERDVAEEKNELNELEDDDDFPEDCFDDLMKEDILDNMAVVDAWIPDDNGGSDTEEKRDRRRDNREDSKGRDKRDRNSDDRRRDIRKDRDKQTTRNDRDRENRNSRDRRNRHSRSRSVDRNRDRRHRNSRERSRDRHRRNSRGRSTDRNLNRDRQKRNSRDRSTDRQYRDKQSRYSRDRNTDRCNLSNEKKERNRAQSSEGNNKVSTVEKSESDKKDRERRSNTDTHHKDDKDLNKNKNNIEGIFSRESSTQILEEKVDVQNLDTCIKDGIDVLPPGTENEFNFPLRDESIKLTEDLEKKNNNLREEQDSNMMPYDRKQRPYMLDYNDKKQSDLRERKMMPNSERVLKYNYAEKWEERRRITANYYDEADRKRKIDYHDDDRRMRSGSYNDEADRKHDDRRMRSDSIERKRLRQSRWLDDASREKDPSVVYDVSKGLYMRTTNKNKDGSKKPLHKEGDHNLDLSPISDGGKLSTPTLSSEFSPISQKEEPWHFYDKYKKKRLNRRKKRNRRNRRNLSFSPVSVRSGCSQPRSHSRPRSRSRPHSHSRLRSRSRSRSFVCSNSRSCSLESIITLSSDSPYERTRRKRSPFLREIERKLARQHNRSTNVTLTNFSFAALYQTSSQDFNAPTSYPAPSVYPHPPGTYTTANMPSNYLPPNYSQSYVPADMSQAPQVSHPPTYIPNYSEASAMPPGPVQPNFSDASAMAPGPIQPNFLTAEAVQMLGPQPEQMLGPQLVHMSGPSPHMQMPMLPPSQLPVPLPVPSPSQPPGQPHMQQMPRPSPMQQMQGTGPPPMQQMPGPGPPPMQQMPGPGPPPMQQLAGPSHTEFSESRPALLPRPPAILQTPSHAVLPMPRLAAQPTPRVLVSLPSRQSVPTPVQPPSSVPTSVSQPLYGAHKSFPQHEPPRTQADKSSSEGRKGSAPEIPPPPKLSQFYNDKLRLSTILEASVKVPVASSKKVLPIDPALITRCEEALYTLEALSDPFFITSGPLVVQNTSRPTELQDIPDHLKNYRSPLLRKSDVQLNFTNHLVFEELYKVPSVETRSLKTTATSAVGIVENAHDVHGKQNKDNEGMKDSKHDSSVKDSKQSDLSVKDSKKPDSSVTDSKKSDSSVTDSKESHSSVKDSKQSDSSRRDSKQPESHDRESKRYSSRDSRKYVEEPKKCKACLERADKVMIWNCTQTTKVNVKSIGIQVSIPVSDSGHSFAKNRTWKKNDLGMKSDHKDSTTDSRKNLSVSDEYRKLREEEDSFYRSLAPPSLQKSSPLAPKQPFSSGLYGQSALSSPSLAPAPRKGILKSSNSSTQEQISQFSHRPSQSLSAEFKAYLSTREASGSRLLSSDVTGSRLLSSDVTGSQLLPSDVTGSRLLSSDISDSHLLSRDLPVSRLEHSEKLMNLHDKDLPRNKLLPSAQSVLGRPNISYPLTSFKSTTPFKGDREYGSSYDARSSFPGSRFGPGLPRSHGFPDSSSELLPQTTFDYQHSTRSAPILPDRPSRL